MEDRKCVLLVEDSDRDAELITAVLSDLRPGMNIVRARDGVEAWNYLKTNNGAAAMSLVLLDIKLPRMSGIETLARMKSDDYTKCIPVVMFTSSRESRDVQDCYRIGANAYVVKPIDYSDLMEILRHTGQFWFNVNVTP
jgi:two-component system, response regulator